MNLLLLFLLLQDRPIEDHIAAFLAGDEGARIEVLRRGALAISPLLRARKSHSERALPLLYELKRAASYPEECAIEDRLAQHLTLRLETIGFEQALKNLGNRGYGPVFLDRFEWSALKTTMVVVDVRDRPAYVAFDQICIQTGLDYGFFHNSIVVGLPGRLWPQQGLQTPTPPEGEELVKARLLVDQLDDDLIEVREDATRKLLRLGASAVPLLEARLKTSVGECAIRCHEILLRVRPEARGLFGPPAAARQGAATFLNLERIRIKVERRDVPLKEIARLLSLWGVRSEMRNGVSEREVTLATQGQCAFDALALMTQAAGLDFVIHEDKVVFDTREAISKGSK